jgi:L-2,4-diaminobutyric acid acetyltransferase
MERGKSNALAPPDQAAAIHIGPPSIDDGVDCWRLADASRVLDVNSRYAYLLWCRDFAATSVVARRNDEVVGFITGYRRPDQPGTLMVWQVAVDASTRGEGVAGRMLDALVEQVRDIDHLETTVTPDNAASIALFTGFARRREAAVDVEQLFGGAQLAGDGHDHEPEDRYRIGPFPATPTTPATPAAPADQRRPS